MSGALSVVAAGTPGTYVLPEIVAAFQQVHPGVRMQFEQCYACDAARYPRGSATRGA